MILSFNSAFVPQIIAGTKVHTIRSGHRWHVGQAIEFYAGDDPATRHKFTADATVQAVQAVQIAQLPPPACLTVDGRPLRGQELLEFARRDGFASPDRLLQFIAGHYALPFTGQLIHWTGLRY